eukprot:2837973-Pleurochrysis_carterae.AAC.3
MAVFCRLSAYGMAQVLFHPISTRPKPPTARSDDSFLARQSGRNGRSMSADVRTSASAHSLGAKTANSMAASGSRTRMGSSAARKVRRWYGQRRVAACRSGSCVRATLATVSRASTIGGRSDRSTYAQ